MDYIHIHWKTDFGIRTGGVDLQDSLVLAALAVCKFRTVVIRPGLWGRGIAVRSVLRFLELLGFSLLLKLADF